MNTDQTSPAPAYPPQNRPGEGLGIAAFVCAFFVPILGIIFGHVSRGQAKRAGQQPTGLATAGTILGWIFTVISVLLIIVLITAAARTATDISNLPTTYPTS
jgi:hypothetical protein